MGTLVGRTGTAPKIIGLVAAGCAAAIALAGCGGSNSNGGSPTTPGHVGNSPNVANSSTPNVISGATFTM